MSWVGEIWACVGGGKGGGVGASMSGPTQRSPPNPLQSGHHGGGGGDRESQGVKKETVIEVPKNGDLRTYSEPGI